MFKTLSQICAIVHPFVMILTFQLLEDYATCEYPPWFLALCKEYKIDFDYVKNKDR